jgi:LacI family transcriptional regulator, galactose operon repressor
MVRIKDVAEHAGVSTATVSRVINGKSVRPRFRKAVERSVKELGFRPNRQARLLRLQRSNEVALILPDIENPFYTTLAPGVIDVTRACEHQDHPAQPARLG